MIKTAVKFDETSIKVALGSKKYILEATLEEEIDGGDFSSVLATVRMGKKLSNRQRYITAALKTHRPVQIVKFVGMKKYSAEWWGAVVRLAPSIGSYQKYDILVIGWKNNHGVAAVTSTMGDEGGCNTLLDERISQKEDGGYIKEMELVGVVLGGGAVELPRIPGLPDPTPDPILSKPFPRGGSIASKFEPFRKEEAFPSAEPGSFLEEEFPEETPDPKKEWTTKIEPPSWMEPPKIVEKEEKKIKRSKKEKKVSVSPEEGEKKEEGRSKTSAKVLSFKEKMQQRKKESDW